MPRHKYIIPDKNGVPVVPIMTSPDETILMDRRKGKTIFETDKEHPELKDFEVPIEEKPKINLSEMTVKELKAYAKKHGIDIRGLRRKAEIIKKIAETL